MNDHSLKSSLVIIVLIIYSFGCSMSISKSSDHAVFEINTPACIFPDKSDLERLHLVMPTVGVFIGVSEYGEKAQVFSTPAHATNAGLFQAPFYQAAFFHPSQAKEMWLTDSDQDGELNWQNGDFGMSFIDKNYVRHTYWLKTTADVSLDLNNPIERGAFRVLMQIPGMKGKHSAHFKTEIAIAEAFHSPEIDEYAEIGEAHNNGDSTHLVFSSGNWEAVTNGNSLDFVLGSQVVDKKIGLSKPVTKERIISNITDAINEAQNSFRENGRVLLIVYISAHGRLGGDGQPYILPYDAIAEDSRSWIAQRDIIESVKQFLQNGGQQELGKHAIVVFDSCQINSPNRALFPAVELPIPAGMTLVQSVLPGQYAWHWTVESKENENVGIDEHRWGLPRPPSRLPEGHIQRVSTARMSILPISSTCVINNAQKILDRQKLPGGVINAFGWLEEMKNYGNHFLDRIPDFKAADLLQDINVRYGSKLDQDLPVFLLMPRVDDMK
jgi:hypothetical protein